MNYNNCIHSWEPKKTKKRNKCISKYCNTGTFVCCIARTLNGERPNSHSILYRFCRYSQTGVHDPSFYRYLSERATTYSAWYTLKTTYYGARSSNRRTGAFQPITRDNFLSKRSALDDARQSTKHEHAQSGKASPSILRLRTGCDPSRRHGALPPPPPPTKVSGTKQVYY